MPLVMAMSFRGEWGERNWWGHNHAQTMEPILNALRIPFRFIARLDDIKPAIRKAYHHADSSNWPVAMVFTGEGAGLCKELRRSKRLEPLHQARDKQPFDVPCRSEDQHADHHGDQGHRKDRTGFAGGVSKIPAVDLPHSMAGNLQRFRVRLWASRWWIQWQDVANANRRECEVRRGYSPEIAASCRHVRGPSRN
jgi:hypothetical protein